jgi:hypothetical protein
MLPLLPCNEVCRSGDDVCPLNYVYDLSEISGLAHEKTLFTFTDVTTSTEQVQTRLERIRTLLHRLARVRDAGIEAELINQLTLETEAVRKLRANAAHATSEATSTSSRRGGRKVDFDRATRAGAHVGGRPARRVARHG